MCAAPDTPTGRERRERSRPRRPALRRIVDGLLVVAMVAGVYLLLPRLGGWARERPR